jgi:TonB family protein
VLVAGLVVAALMPLAAVRSAATQYHTLSGSVVDPSGRVLPSVAVTLTSTTSGAKYEVRTDAAGRYEFVGLPPATYALAAASPGFRPYAESLPITADRERSFQMIVGTLQETVSVRADTSPAEPLDPAAIARRDEGRRRAAARRARAEAMCTAGPPVAAGGNILPPLKIGDTRPVYPEHLRTAGIGGTVTLNATLADDGHVRTVSNVTGPHPDLNAAAEQAIRAWEFTPTLLNCEPIEVAMTVTVNFGITR